MQLRVQQIPQVSVATQVQYQISYVISFGSFIAN